MNILISESDIKTYGNQVIEYTADFKSEIDKFNSLIETINSIWDGADALKYVNAMKEKYINGLLELHDVLNEYGEYLRDVPETYSSLEEVFTARNIEV